MASAAQDKRPSILLTVLTLAVVIIVGIVAFQWLTGLVLAFIRLIMVLIAFYLMFRIGMYLLRKGR